MSTYVGGKGRQAPVLVPVWHDSSDETVRSRAAQWGLVDLGTSAGPASTSQEEPTVSAGMTPVRKRPAGMTPVRKRPAGCVEDCGARTLSKVGRREQVGPPCVCVRPPVTGAQATKLLAPGFGRLNVHGKPWRVEAYPPQRRNTTAFRLRCLNCNHKTCNWSGVAVYDAQTKQLTPTSFMTSITEKPRRVGRVAASGEPRAETSVAPRFVCTQTKSTNKRSTSL